MAIDFDSEPYLAKIDFTEAELDSLCVYKVEVTGVSSRQSVKIKYNDKEYEDVPVWMHTDCGARHWYIKGFDAEKAGQDKPIAPTAEEYFKDAALMFPFPGGVYVNTSPYAEFQTVTPYALAVFIASDKASTPLGVINILDSITEFSEDVAYRTYRPYLKFRLRHMSGLTVLWSRSYLYDILGERAAKSPTWSYSLNKWVTPIIDLEDIADADINKELSLFLSGSYYFTESRMEHYPQETSFDGTNGTAVLSFPFVGGSSLNNITTNIGYPLTTSYCEGVPHTPAWTGTISVYEYDAECVCGFGTFVSSNQQQADMTFHLDIIKKIPNPTIGNVLKYGNLSVARYYEEKQDADLDWQRHPVYTDLNFSNYVGITFTDKHEKLVLTDLTKEDEDPLEIRVNYLDREDETVGPASEESLTVDGFWEVNRSQTGKLYYEISAGFTGNFFMSCDSFSFLQVASFSKTNNDYSVISQKPEDIIAYSMSAYTGNGFIEADKTMQFITDSISGYHKELVTSGYYSDWEQIIIDTNGPQRALLYFFPLEKAKITIEIQGLYFVPFNRDIALLLEAEGIV